MPKAKRVSKSKSQIVQDVKLAQDAERRRSLIREKIFPFLLKSNDTIGWTKLFLQSYSGLVNGVFDDRRSTTTIGDITPEIESKLDILFKNAPKGEKDRYIELTNILKDISIQDVAYATEMSRYIDGFFIKQKEKENVSYIPIEEILGK